MPSILILLNINHVEIKGGVMKKMIVFLLFNIFIGSIYATGSREYQPASEMENKIYQEIDKSIWPDDVRKNPELYKNSKIGWVGIIEKYMTDVSSPEYNIIGFYVKHHYYDWIEDFSASNKPILLSPNGEGYFISYYIIRKEIDPEDLAADVKENLIINYGSPIEVWEDGTIILSTEYLRIIDKEYVNPNWLNYGRSGIGEETEGNKE